MITGWIPLKTKFVGQAAKAALFPRRTIVLLSMVLLLSLTACGNKKEETGGKEKAQKAQSTQEQQIEAELKQQMNMYKQIKQAEYKEADEVRKADQEQLKKLQKSRQEVLKIQQKEQTRILTGTSTAEEEEDQSGGGGQGGGGQGGGQGGSQGGGQGGGNQ